MPNLTIKSDATVISDYKSRMGAASPNELQVRRLMSAKLTEYGPAPGVTIEGPVLLTSVTGGTTIVPASATDTTGAYVRVVSGANAGRRRKIVTYNVGVSVVIESANKPSTRAFSTSETSPGAPLM